MTTPPVYQKPSGVSPKWSNLPRRKCDNCGKSYRPSRPLRADQKYGFCNRDCNKQFYKHGAAFIQIKQAMEKELPKLLGKLIPEAVFVACEKRFREIVREELENAHFYDVESRPVSVIPFTPEPPALTEMRERLKRTS